MTQSLPALSTASKSLVLLRLFTETFPVPSQVTDGVKDAASFGMTRKRREPKTFMVSCAL